MKVHETLIDASLDAPFSGLVITAKQFDDASRYVTATIYNGAGLLNFDYVDTITAQAKKPDGSEVTVICELDKNESRATFEMTKQMLAASGDVVADFAIKLLSGGVVSTGKFIIRVEESPMQGVGYQSTSDYENMQQAVAEAYQLIAVVEGAVYAADRIIQDPEHRLVTDTQMAIWNTATSPFAGFYNRYTTFNSDGSITETDGNGSTRTTTFNSDGTITEVLTQEDAVALTKKTIFTDDAISETITEG